MEETRTLQPALVVLADIAALLDSMQRDRSLLPDADRLALVTSARVLSGRLQALTVIVAAEAAASEASDRQVGVPLASWLAASGPMTRREAHRLIAQGRDLTRFPDLTKASVNGAVGFEQATAISAVLTRLPDDFTASQVADAEQTMLAYASEFDSAGLSRLSHRLVEVLDPDGCDERDARRLERDLKHAQAARHLTFLPDGHGSVLIRGSLPTLDAEPFSQLVDAYAQAERRAALELMDPLAETLTPAMRRADALCALVAAHQRDSLAPAYGGDRPRIVVTLSYDKLHDRALRAGLLRTGERITAGELRRLACDADLLPAVLGGPSEILDVGRTQRLVTPAIRAGLDLRDGGCVFPGCDQPPGTSQAHHIIPWWQGGSTSLGNLALLCPHHHGLIEPSRIDANPPGINGPSPRPRWELRIGADGVQEVLPPTYVDRRRTPRRHQRFRLPPSG